MRDRKEYGDPNDETDRWYPTCPDCSWIGQPDISRRSAEFASVAHFNDRHNHR